MLGIAQAPLQIDNARKCIEYYHEHIAAYEAQYEQDKKRISQEHGHNYASDPYLQTKLTIVEEKFQKKLNEIAPMIAQEKDIINKREYILNNQEVVKQDLEDLITKLQVDIQTCVAEQEAIQRDIEALSSNIHSHEEKNNKDKKQLVINPPHLGYNVTALGVIGLLYKTSHRSHYMG